VSVGPPVLDDPAASKDRSGRHGRWRAVALVVVPLVAFTGLLGSGLGKDPRALPSQLIGKPAPGLSLPQIRGAGTVRLADLRGQVLVVNFWASWCAECVTEHPALLAAWQRYRERGVVFLGVVFQDTATAATDFMDRMGGDWPVVLDGDSAAALDYGVFGVPETFVIAPDGTIVDKQVGEVTYEWLIERIDAALRSGGAKA
jgi:cytochrome c biogenesis protein CcmG/thiol:disulfide interchange protein DsbE